MTTAPKKSSIHLELGNTIRLDTNDPANKTFHLVPMFIDYIDEHKIRLISTETRERYIFAIVNNRLIGPQDAEEYIQIRQVQVLSRSKEKGYARQNGLLENTRVEIQIRISPSAPMITITGTIFALVEDRISIRVSSAPAELAELHTLNIDFGYRGLPEELHIEQIIILDGTPTSSSISSSIPTPDFSMEDLEDISEEIISTTEMSMDIDGRSILDAQPIDDFVYEPIQQIRSVAKSKMRYSLEHQISNILDEMLVNLPPEQRSQKVMERIYLRIQRYIELRREFSIFEDGIISRAKQTSHESKPLKEFMSSHTLHWLLMTVLLSRDITVLKPEMVNVRSILDINNILDGNPDKINTIEYPRLNRDLPDSMITAENSTEALVKYNSELFGISSNSKCTNKSDYVDILNMIIRQRFSKGDEMSVGSIVAFPKPFQDYTRAWLPSSNILERVFQSSLDIYPFIFENPTMFDVITARRGERETPKLPRRVMSNNQQLHKLWTNFLRDSSNRIKTMEIIPSSETENLDSFLTEVIPKTMDILQILQPTMPLSVQTSIHSVVKWLEPYGITMKNITFSHKKFIVSRCIRHIQYLMREAARKQAEKNKKSRAQMKQPDKNYISKYENLERDITVDFGNSAFLEKIRDATSLIYDDGPKHAEDKLKQIIKKPTPSGKSNVVKEYDSEDSLRLDNGHAELLCDSKYDDTPYFLSKLIVDEDVQDPRLYKEYLREVLTYQYDCGEFVSDNLLDAVVLGKRRVYNGELAVIPLENNTYAYYKYDAAKLVWVFHTNTSEPPLVPTKPDPEQNKWLDKCASNLMEKRTETFLKKIAENNANVKYEDIVERYKLYKQRNESIEDYLEGLLDDYYNRKLGRDVFFELQLRKPSYNAWKLAEAERIYNKKMAETGATTIKSPHLPLVYYILSIEDIQKQSLCICNFKARFCREAIPPTEDKFWFYCRSSSAKLLPTCIYELAQAAKKSTSEYVATMSRICRTQGIINDEGNAFIDKHSGFFLRKIDDVEDVMFDDNDRIIFAAAPLEQEDDTEKDVSDTSSLDELGLFLKEIAQRYQTILGVSDIDMPFILRFSRELIDTRKDLFYNIKNVNDYNKFLLNAKQDIAKSPTFERFMRGVYISLVGVSVLIAIQTTVPRVTLKMNKTNAKSCVQKCISARDTYPFDEDDTKKTGIECILCVAKLVATSFYENPNLINKQLFMNYYFQQVIKSREIKLRYRIAREFVETMKPWGITSSVSLVTTDIPFKSSATVWNDFMPPLVPFDISSPDTTNACTEKGSMVHITHYIVKCIQDIVRDSTPLLSTLSNIPFLQNACCYDGAKFMTPLEYFGAIRNNPAFENSLKCSIRISQLMREYSLLTKPSCSYFVGKHPANIYTQFAPTDRLKFRAIFHYAQFNTNRLPNDLMSMQEILKKPDGYIETDSVEINVSRASQNFIKNKDAIFDDVMKIVRLRGKFESKHTLLVEEKEEEEEEEEDTTITLRGEELAHQIDEKRTFLYNIVLRPFYDGITTNRTRLELDSVLDKLDVIVGTPSIERIRFIQNCIYLLTRFIPAIVCHNIPPYRDSAGLSTPKSWKLFERHVLNIMNVVEEEEYIFSKYRHDTLIEHLMTAESDEEDTFLEKCTQIFNRYVQSPPSDTSISDLHEISRYGLYKILDVYVKMACKPGDIFRWCAKTGKSARGYTEMSLSDELSNDNQIIWMLLKDCIDYFSHVNNKLIIDYQTIIERMRAVRTAEKKTITDKFRGMSNEDRKVMNMFKKYKVEEWNVTDINKYGSRTFIPGSSGDNVTADETVLGGEEDVAADETLLGGQEEFEEND